MRRISTPRHGRLWAVLLSCVLLAQWLALAHSVVHPGGQAGLRLQLAQAGAPDLLQQLDADHAAGSADCLALDQLCHGAPDAAEPALPLLQLLAQPAPGAAQSATPRTPWRRQLARAPPVLA
ncbi:hypothetical protein [Inhella proteolytica]|uniref:DUF2946 domain-containing protein n=1 Tax=Inhella proteolytica TaxID=2795029 RepID=A0A931J0K6_9BURK|nr:hypothetical protein [Inhella proteolytica]MBH9577266.1 hypothetical protein [Inhella proteolytica]